MPINASTIPTASIASDSTGQDTGLSTCGVDGLTTQAALHELLGTTRPAALGMATAFLSLPGARIFEDLARHGETQTVRVVVGISGAVTQPVAIEHLASLRYDVRLGSHTPGIFHPKLLAGGARFDRKGRLREACCGYVGSANFTMGGMSRNLEIAFATTDAVVSRRAGEAFSTIWSRADRLTVRRVTEYERLFARRQRDRSPEDLHLLGVAEQPPGAGRATSLVPPPLSNAVWAGLQSFTGEHTFQVEFPRRAGEALRALLGTTEERVPIACSDGVTRSMTYRYYTDNGMYRLNVPNDVPLVAWARHHRRGALVVGRDPNSTSRAVRAEIVRGHALSEIVERSTLLGTVGRTPTRQFGWF